MRIDYLSRQDLDNPFYGVLPASTPLGSSRKISRAALLSVYPQFTSMETTTNEGRSWYHSLQTRFDKRFGAGLTAGISYTWSKLMEAVAYLNDMDPSPYRVISATDFPHRLSASWIYELPFGRGRAFRSSRQFAGLVDGWQVEGLYVYQSGSPLDFGNIIFNGDVKESRSLPSSAPPSAGSTPKPVLSVTAPRRWPTTCARSRCDSPEYADRP